MKHYLKLIIDMSWDDFKAKYSGSAFGTVWAFVQPIVTILLYWFVFEYGLKSVSSSPNVPFVIWMMAALVPYLFFADAISSVTSSFLQYSYLVKKSVFNVSVLPAVKLISSSIVHIFFLMILLVMSSAYYINIGLEILQLPYYFIALVAYVMSIAYFCASVVVFFKDLTQIISIITLIGMWATPIMWPPTNIPDNIAWLFYFNPIFYITEGYRDAITCSGIFFWDKPEQTIIYIAVLILNAYISAKVYKKLNKQFAEVL